MTDLRRRIEALETEVPEAIVLHLDNGREFRHPGPSLEFYFQGLEQIRKGRGPIAEVIDRVVDAEGCGRLWEVLKVLAHGPAEKVKRGRKK